MKRLRIGRRRSRAEQAASPLELALAPALVDGRWQVPDRFNFARDVVEALAQDPKRRALTFSGEDGIIEPRTFLQLAEGGARWASALRERGVRPGDRVLVLMTAGARWLEVVLGCLKAGAVTVPCAPRKPASALEVLVAASGASLVVADHATDRELAQMSFAPDVLYADEVEAPKTPDAPGDTPTHDTSSRDIAFILSSSATASGPRVVAHTHGSTFASRLQAEHWLDASRGDAVWFTADTGSAPAVWGLLGPWSRGAELVLHHGEFDPQERLDLIHRLSVTILCQSPAEYRALAELRRRDLERYQPRRLRRLVSTGDYLEPDVVAVFEEAWGMTIHDGYGQAETNVIVANGADTEFRSGSMGVALPGHQVAVVDGQGNELPAGIEGDLAVRGRPPTLFSGYWDSPEETKDAFSGDWYVTGDVATRDEDGFFWFVGRASDLIASRGRTFGPYEVEKVLREHAAVQRAAVVGVRDLERGGHFVRAFVVLAPRAAGSDQLEAELRQHVAESLPEQHVPREVEFVDELPTTANGKVRRDELRERAVVGRSLWDSPDAAGAVAVEAAAYAPAEPSPIEAAPEPTLPKPSAAAPEPVFPRAPEPVVETHEPVSPVDPEPVAESLEPVFLVQPEPVALPDPVEAVAPPAESLPPAPEPQPLAKAEADNVSLVEPQEIERVERMPVFAAEPEPAVEPEPVAAAESEAAPERIVEPVPEAALAAPPAEPAPPEPAALPEYVIDPSHAPTRPVPPPEPEPEEAPDLGPLPDYVVDPDRKPTLEPVPGPTMRQPTPGPTHAAETEPPLAGLGLKPVTEFPRRDPSEQGDSSGTRRSRLSDTRPDRDRSEGEPGDESEEVGWMQGLSSRLSAYSLDADPDLSKPEPAADEDADEPEGA